MANPTYNLIASNSVGSGGAGAFTFSSIPSTYTDLQIVASLRDTSASASSAVYLSFNGVSSGYSTKNLYGNGGSVNTNSSSTGYSGETDASTAAANTFSNLSIYIPNYTSSNTKSVSVDNAMEDYTTTAYLNLIAWNSTTTAAITSVTLTPATLFVQNSTFYLYGIKNS
jgi:hypothetical protein